MDAGGRQRMEQVVEYSDEAISSHVILSGRLPRALWVLAMTMIFELIRVSIDNSLLNGLDFISESNSETYSVLDFFVANYPGAGRGASLRV